MSHFNALCFLEELSLTWLPPNFLHRITVPLLRLNQSNCRECVLKKRGDNKNRQQDEENKRPPDLQADFMCSQESLATFAALTCSNLQAGGRHKVNPLCAFCIH